MSALIFDTHKFIKRLTEAGMPLGQAEVLAEEQAKLYILKVRMLSPKVCMLFISKSRCHSLLYAAGFAPLTISKLAKYVQIIECLR